MIWYYFDIITLVIVVANKNKKIKLKKNICAVIPTTLSL